MTILVSLIKGFSIAHKKGANFRRRALSPVIATVILVAVGITIAIAAAYWLGGISATYTGYESIEFKNGVCTWSDSDDEWTVQIELKNSRTDHANLINVFINGVEVDQYNSTGPAPEGMAVTDMTSPHGISSGETVFLNIYIDGPGGVSGWQTLSAGTTVEVKIHSAAGMDYPRLLLLV